MMWLPMAIAFFGSGQAPVPPPPNWSPVLDCQRQVYAMDGLICENAQLLAQTREVEAAFTAALDRAPAADRAGHAADQEAWSKRRNLCAFQTRAATCVKRLQKQRLAYLARR